MATRQSDSAVFDSVELATVSAICFAAIADAEDADGVVVQVKSYAVAANAETKLGRVDALQTFDVLCARIRRSVQRII